MREILATVALAATICSTAYSQTIRDIRLSQPVDTNTITLAYSSLTNAIAVAYRLGALDTLSLAKAIQVGQDLNLIESATNGWVVAVSNIVEVGDAHIPGTLFLGGRIYGVPGESGRIDIDGCDFYYNRQIPGDSGGTNGWGNIVTDPYMEWRLSTFYTQFWEAVAGASDLPTSLAADLAAYSSATGQLANVSADIVSAKSSALSAINAVKDEINATNQVIRAAITQALSQASGGGGSAWTASSTSSSDITLSDHAVISCSASDSSYTFTLPTWNGTPARCAVWFSNAYDWSDNTPSFYVSGDATVYYDDYLSISYFWSSSGMYYFEFRQIDQYTWFLSAHPVGYYL